MSSLGVASLKGASWLALTGFSGLNVFQVQNWLSEKAMLCYGACRCVPCPES